MAAIGGYFGVLSTGGVVGVVLVPGVVDGVPVVLVPMPVLVSVVPVDGLVVVGSVEVSVPVEERGLVVDGLLLRGVVGPARPSGAPLRVVEVSMPASALMP